MDAGWFDTARQRFQEADEYPLIDDEEVIDRAAIWNCFPDSCGFGSVRPDRQFEAALTSDHHELAVRFVWLNVFFRLAHCPAEEFLQAIHEQEEAPEHRSQFQRYLKSLVTLVDVDECKDPLHIRWEVVNASAIQDWSRAKGLYDRLEALAAKADVAELWALRGRHDLLSVFAGSWELDGLDWWACRRQRGMNRYLLATRALFGKYARDLSPEELNRLGDAANHFSKAFRANGDVDIVYRLLSVRCQLTLGKWHDAAAECQRLLRGGRSQFNSWPDDADDWFSQLYSLLVEACSSAGETEKAIVACQRWSEEFPDQLGIHERLSQLYQSTGEIGKAHEHLLREVDLNPKRGDDPLVSRAIAFGDCFREMETKLNELQRRAPPQDFDSVHTLVRSEWPAVEKLTRESIESWVWGCYLLQKRDPNDPTLSALCFGRAVERELCGKVFRPFRESLSRAELQSMGNDKGPLPRFLKKDEIELGVMLYEFVKYQDKAWSEAVSQFRKWLEAVRPDLPAALRAIDLEGILDLYNPTKHLDGTRYSWDDALRMRKCSRDVLSATLEP